MCQVALALLASAGGDKCSGCNGDWVAGIDGSVKNITIVVPVMDRAKEVAQLIKQLDVSMTEQKLYARIFVVEQVESYLGIPGHQGDAFNKGRLLNAAVDALGERAGSSILVHDADVWETCPGAVNYRACADGDGKVHQLYGYLPNSKTDFCMGGIWCIPPRTWRSVDGFSNEFPGWGQEDLDFGKRLVSHDVTPEFAHMQVRRTDVKQNSINQCVYDNVNGGPNPNHPNALRNSPAKVGTVTEGLKNVTYMWVGENQIVATESGTVTVMRIALPQEVAIENWGPYLERSSDSSEGSWWSMPARLVVSSFALIVLVILWRRKGKKK